MYPRAAVEAGKALGGVDRPPAPLRLSPEVPIHLPARDPGQLVTRLVAADEEAVVRVAHLGIDLATEIPTRGIDHLQVAVVESTDRVGRLAEETHPPLMMRVPRMIADQLPRHQKGEDTRIRLAAQDPLVEQDGGPPDLAHRLIPDHRPAVPKNDQFESLSVVAAHRIVVEG